MGRSSFLPVAAVSLVLAAGGIAACVGEPGPAAGRHGLMTPQGPAGPPDGGVGEPDPPVGSPTSMVPQVAPRVPDAGGITRAPGSHAAVRATGGAN